MKFGIWLTRWLFAQQVMIRRKTIREYKTGNAEWLKRLRRLPTNAEIECALFGNHLDVHTRRPV